MRKFNLAFIATLLLTTSTIFAQQTDEGLDDFNIPGVEKSLDELVGPEPEVSGIPTVNEPVAQDTTLKPAELQKATPKPVTQKVVTSEKPLEVPGVEWVRVSPERGGLTELSFEVPESWTRKDDIWTVKKGDDVETGLKVSLTKFKEEDLAKAAKSMPEFSSMKSTINGNVVIVISSKRVIKKTAYVIKMAFYGAPMFAGKKQLMMTFSSANIKRDMPIFEHIMQTVNSSRKPQKAGETANVALIPTSKGTIVRLVNTAPGDGEGAVIAADGYYKATFPGYKGEVFFAASIDLNNDGMKEWFVQAREPANCYGTKDSCMTFYFGHGPGGKLVDLGYGRLASVAVLDSTTNGYRDLNIDGKLHSFNGSKYYSGKAEEVKNNSFVKAGPAEAERNSGVTPAQPSSRQTAQADQPISDSGIKWRRTGLKEPSLEGVTIEIPDTWSLKDDGYKATKNGKTITKKGEKIGLGFMVQLERFGEKDVKQMKRDMKGFKEKKINVNGHFVRYFAGQSSMFGEGLDIIFTVFDTPKFGHGKTFGFALVSADIKRDGPVFDHILHSVRFEKANPVVQGIIPLKLERVEIGKAGELAGALKEIEKWGTRKDNVYSFVRVDLDNDGVKEAIIHINQRFGFCKNFDANDSICRLAIMKLNENREWDSIPSPRPIYAKKVGSLPSFTNGYRDLVFDNILYTYDGDQSYREGRQKEVTKKTSTTNSAHSTAPSAENSSPARIDKPAQPAKAATVPGVEWVRVTSANQDMKGILFEVPQNWTRSGDSDTWVVESGSDIEVYLELLSLRQKGMELAATKAHFKNFALSKSVINGIHMNVLTADNKHGGISYNENIVIFGENISYTDGQVTMMFNTSDIERDGPIFQHILQSVRFGQKSLQKAPEPDGPVSADGYSERHIGTLSFSLPIEWQKDKDQSNIVTTMFTTDEFSLQIFHSTGFHPYRELADDLVPISLAGRNAKRYEISYKLSKDVVIELDDVNSLGKRLSFTFTATNKKWTAFQPMFDRIVSSIRFGDVVGEKKREAVAPVSPSTAENWQLYSNPRFGTSIEYPASIFTAMPSPENGDGRTFKSQGGLAEFLIFGSHNALEQTVKELFADQLMSDTFEAILEKSLQNNGYFLKARSNGKIIAQKVILDTSGVFHTFQLSYPEIESAQYDLILTRMIVSFSPIKITQAAPKSEQAPNQVVELAFWQSISNSNDSADFEAYLVQWPGGAFAALAKNNLRRLRKPVEIEATPAPKKKAQSIPRRKYYTPARKTRERSAIMNAARIPVSKSIRQKIIFVVSVLRSDGHWAYLQAVPHRPNGNKLNWSRTPYANDWKNDAMSDVVMVLLRKDGRRWKAIDHVIGPTDVHWVGWLDQYGLPEALFSAP